ncbi:DUF2188 domain-containing protein [Bacillus testis]|uniref:DUF2188 domain-containing protein n=1 Tax=Bacillus testis TaxID=1622072 RepID=UPI00067F1AAA|nr:DUF2188 domain-containing protein [Bacillus testis]
MPWNNHDYPPSMKNLDSDVRKKAIEIANALLDEGYEEGRAIPIATEKAKEYVAKHNPHKERYEVKPHEDGWQVIKEGAERASFVTESKEKALDRARELSDKYDTAVVTYKEDGSKQSD